MSCLLQVTAVEPGGYKTDVAKSRQMLPPHPAYTDETMMTTVIRNALVTPSVVDAYGETAKGVETVYQLSLLPTPPGRLPLGPEGVQFARTHISEMTADVDKAAAWQDEIAASL